MPQVLEMPPTPHSSIISVCFALNARTGELLWHVNLAGTVASGPITYQANGVQYVDVAADNALYAFGLPE